MFQKRNRRWLVLFVGLGLACGSGNQMSKANKLVGEANESITKSQDLSLKANSVFEDLFGINFDKAEDLEIYKKENSSKFDELISLRQEIEKSETEAIDKFEQALKLEIHDKYKEYLIDKIKEFTKRVEADKLVVSFVKSFLGAKDMGAVDEIFDDFNTKTKEIEQAADEFMKRAEQTKKDNRNVVNSEY